MKKNDILEPLNGIKGIGAVIIAFFFHYGNFLSVDLSPLYCTLTRNLCENGWLMVELFFMLSGIVFTLLYYPQINSGMKGIEFTVLRISRLYPMHLFTLCMVAVVQAIRNTCNLGQWYFIKNDLYHFILHIFMIHQFGFQSDNSFNQVSWTVSISVVLYFVFFWISRKSIQKSGFLMCCLLMLVAGFAMIQSNLYVFLNWPWIGRGMIAFFTGCIFAVVVSYEKINIKILDIVFICVLLIWILFRACLWMSMDNNGWLVACCYSIILFPALVYFSIRIRVIRKILSGKAMKALGKLSFSLFMIHYPIQLILVTFNEIFSLEWNYETGRFCMLYIFYSMTAAYVALHYVEESISGKIRKYYYDTMAAAGK